MIRIVLTTNKLIYNFTDGWWRFSGWKWGRNGHQRGATESYCIKGIPWENPVQGLK